MSIFRPIALVLTLAGIVPTLAQISELNPHYNSPSAQTFDASGNELRASPFRPGTHGEPAGRGTISVQELLNPLEGKGLQILLKAQALLARGDSAKAMEQLHAAMRYPAAEPYALGILATEHLKHGDVDSAIVELQSALLLLPGKAANHSNLALALAIRGRNDEGLKEARKALQLDSGRPKTRYVMGQILLQMGRREEAEFHLKKAAVDLPGVRALLRKYFTE